MGPSNPSGPTSQLLRPGPPPRNPSSATNSDAASIHSLATIRHDASPLPAALAGAELPHLVVRPYSAGAADDSDDDGMADSTTAAGTARSQGAASTRAPARRDRRGAAVSSSSTDSLSSRSDASEEAAGLVSRMSDEEERQARRDRYERRLGARGFASAVVGGGGGGAAEERFDGGGDDDEEDEDEVGDDGRARLGGRGGGDADAGPSGGSRYDSSTRGEVGLEDGGDDDEEEIDDLHAPPGGRFEDRGEAGGWSARIKERGLALQVWAISIEALPTLVLALISLMLSGELLVHLARWPVFVKVDKLFILTPILLNLKGNLEMNLSLRMSTSANIGELDIRRTRETLIFGNMALLQVQALIVSAFAGLLASVLGVFAAEPVERGKADAPSAVVRAALARRKIIHKHPNPNKDPALRLRNGYFEFVLVIAVSMLSASLSSAALGSFMCALVVAARRMGANPDNIASPLAASLGDLLTLAIMGLLGSGLLHFEGTILATVILVALLLACAGCFVVAHRNTYVRELLSSGWVPLLLAMFISSGAGLVLDAFVQRYEGFALLSPVTTGMPGACAAIFASRSSTVLHSGKSAGVVAMMASQRGAVGEATRGSRGRRRRTSRCLGSLRARLPWCSSSSSSSASWTSLLPVTPPPPLEGWLVPVTLFCLGTLVSAAFLLLTWAAGQMRFGWPFALSFLAATMLSMLGALAISHLLCVFLWSRDYDPDIYCLPYVSSLVDVLGQLLLVAAFGAAKLFGDEVTAAVNGGGGGGGHR